MTPTDWATLMIPLAAFLPFGYFAYLHITKDYEWAREKLHSFNGNKYYHSEEGGMAIDDENWMVYLYRY